MPDDRRPGDDLLLDARGRHHLTGRGYAAPLCAEVDEGRSACALLLTRARGKAFASGAGISQFRTVKTPEEGLECKVRVARGPGALERVRVPAIASIAGLVAPQHCFVLMDDPAVLDITALKRKSVSVHWG